MVSTTRIRLKKNKPEQKNFLLSLGCSLPYPELYSDACFPVAEMYCPTVCIRKENYEPNIKEKFIRPFCSLVLWETVFWER